MGCWNETCALSNTPIHHGDPVVAFMLAVPGGHGSSNDYCYTDGIAFPLGFPIFGTYNDYGNVENIEPNPLNTFLASKLYPLFLASALKKDADRADFVAEQASRKSPDTFEGLLFLVERHMPTLVVKGGKLVPQAGGHITREDLNVPITLWMAHRHLAEAAMGMSNGAKVAEAAHRHVDDWLHPERFGHHDIPRLFENTYFLWVNRGFFTEAVEAGLADEVEKALVILGSLNGGMSTLRIPWRVTCGSGSQDSNIRAHYHFNRLVTLHLQEYREALADAVGEDELYEEDDMIAVSEEAIQAAFQASRKHRRLPE